MKKPLKITGFTLVELIVSLALASVILLGLSLFFTSSFHNTFLQQEKTVNTQNQFFINEVIRRKFENFERAVGSIDANYLLFLSHTEDDNLPFTYMFQRTYDPGLPTEHSKLAFKDFFPFNKVNEEGHYGDSGENEGFVGKIKDTATGMQIAETIRPTTNFGGFTILDEKYYFVIPNENEIQVCQPNCTPLKLEFGLFKPDALNHPTDITSDGAWLYVTDSHHGRILRVSPTGDDISVYSVGDLEFPTGIEFYEPVPGTRKIIFAETMADKVRMFDISNPLAEFEEKSPVTIAGGSEECLETDEVYTAQYCKLNRPSGVFVNQDDHELYISDTGSNRVVKVSDPGQLVQSELDISFTAEEQIVLDRVELEFNSEESFSSTPELNTANLSKGIARSDGNKLTYDFSTELAQNITIADCSGSPCDFNEMHVVDELFLPNQDQNFIFGQPPYGAQRTRSTCNAQVDSDPQYCAGVEVSIARAAGTEVKLADILTTVSEGTTITFENVDASDMFPSGISGFNTVNVTLVNRDGEDQIYYVPIHSGNNQIGGDEDRFEVLPIENLEFPTGIAQNGNLIYVMSSLNGNAKTWNTDTKIAGDRPFTMVERDAFLNVDFETDFKIDDLSFTVIDAEGSNILQMEYQGEVGENEFETYQINTALPSN